jgi:hypothetical protein
LKTKRLKEKGIVLVLGMLLLLILTFIGISILNNSIYDILISSNERASIQAFYVAEAGINEFIGRFRANATNQILDDDPSNPNWKVLLAQYPGKGAAQIGFISGDPNSIPSLQNQLDFGVKVKHKVDASNQVIQYGGVSIYLLKSYGFSTDGGNKIIEVELIKSPDYDPPSALYSKMPVHVHGSSTYINGNDSCGTIHNKPGIMTTTLNDPPILESGNPIIDGTPHKITSSSNLPPMSLKIKEMIDYLKDNANYQYSYSEDQTLNGYSNNWGMPSSNGANVPITYNGPLNIIYFNMNGDKTLKLVGNSHGAGILMVEGNLEIKGGLVWYGIILATGSVNYIGSGEKNVTGGIISGGNAMIGIDIGGNASIIYCSVLSNQLTDIIPPYKIIRWREIF